MKRAESAKYPKAILETLVRESFSVTEVLRKLKSGMSGGQQQNCKRWIKRYGLDTSHFTGQAHMRGKAARNRRKWEEVLVLSPEQDWRISTGMLRRALLSSGRAYVCAWCNNPPSWRGKNMTLEINHKNGDWSDNTPQNLEFLCPNCHSTTEDHSKRKSR